MGKNLAFLFADEVHVYCLMIDILLLLLKHSILSALIKSSVLLIVLVHAHYAVFAMNLFSNLSYICNDNTIFCNYLLLFSAYNIAAACFES